MAAAARVATRPQQKLVGAAQGLVTERQPGQLHPGGVAPGRGRQVRPRQVRGGADGREQVLAHDPVLEFGRFTEFAQVTSLVLPAKRGADARPWPGE